MAKILLVEDHEEVWDFVSRRLKRHGFEVLLAVDGRQALEKAAAGKPDLVLLDMNLPVIDGWTVAQCLKSDSDTRHIPIIAMTAHASLEDRERAIDAGCDEHHPKPLDFSRLLAQIETALGARAEPPTSALEGGGTRD